MTAELQRQTSISFAGSNMVSQAPVTEDVLKPAERLSRCLVALKRLPQFEEYMDILLERLAEAMSNSSKQDGAMMYRTQGRAIELEQQLTEIVGAEALHGRVLEAISRRMRQSVTRMKSVGSPV
jgi:hypothetical protein